MRAKWKLVFGCLTLTGNTSNYCSVTAFCSLYSTIMSGVRVKSPVARESVPAPFSLHLVISWSSTGAEVFF